MHNGRSRSNGPRKEKSRNNNRFASGPKKTWDREDGDDRAKRSVRPAKKFRGVRSKNS